MARGSRGSRASRASRASRGSRGSRGIRGIRGNRGKKKSNKRPTVNETGAPSGGSGGASNEEQAVVNPPLQVAITPPRSSEPPSGLPKLEFLLRGDRDTQISPDERAERRQMQDDIDWLAKWLIENAYHQIKESGFEYEVEFMDMDDLIGSGLWWHEAIIAMSNEDVMEQLRVLERQLHEAPDKVYVQVILGWTSYQMWKGGHDIEFMKRQSHVQGVDIQDEYWKMLRQGLREH